jgi:hypothetical protein
VIQHPAPGFSIDPEADDTSTEALEQELTRVKAELEEFQSLIEELPSIYEGKFQHQLRDVAQDIRRLLDERQALQQQIDRSLQGGQDPEALPAPVAESPATPDDELPRSEPEPSRQGFASSKSPVLLLLVSALTALAVAAGVAAFGLWNRARAPQLSAPPPPDAEAPTSEPVGGQPESAEAAPPIGPGSLRLRAQGECWVEVQTLEGRRVFMGTLEEGDERRLDLGEGLRLLAGRPDLLELAIGREPYSTLGSIEQIDWITLRPPADPEVAS